MPAADCLDEAFPFGCLKARGLHPNPALIGLGTSERAVTLCPGQTYELVQFRLGPLVGGPAAQMPGTPLDGVY